MVEKHSFREVKASTIATLKSAEIENFMLETKEILKSLLNIDDNDLLLESDKANARLTKDNLKKLDEMLEKRTNGYPLQYLLGEWDFYGLKFFVGEGVLIPRLETQLLVDLAVSHIKDLDNKVHVADLFSGSGCVGVTLAKQMCDVNSKNAKTTEINCKSIEISENAFAYLQKNIDFHKVSNNVEAVLGSVLDLNIINRFDDESLDLILANPPYISPNDKHLLQKELDFEPDTALFADGDGYYFYEQTIPVWNKKLKKGGLIAFEVGLGQFEKVCEIMKKNDFIPQVKYDYFEIERIVYALK